MTGQHVTAHAAREELYRIIRKEVSFEQKAREALELGRQYLGAENGHLTRIDPATDHWEAIASTDPPNGRFPPGLEVDLGTTYCRRVIETNAQIALHDAPNQGWADDPAFETHGLQCYHGTPLLVDGEPYGTVCFVSDDPRNQFSDGETMFAELIAQVLERELERKQHEAELTRQTNLANVLNRVLRHNLRNDMSVIRGFTQLMADELENPEYSETALTTIDKLIELAEKARQLDRIVGADFEREPTNVTALVEAVAQRVSEDYQNATISVESVEDVTVAVLPTFERALRELIENAAKHGGFTPTVTVSVELVPNAVEFQIQDDGPGLADHEINVLETGSETPLIHGSGLGLWLSHWIVTGHEGAIDATVTDDGTTMTITVPRTPTADIRQQLTQLRRARDQYRAAFDEANDAMIIIDDDARIIDANPEASKIYGMDQQALLGQQVSRFLPDGFEFEPAWREFLEAGQMRETVTIIGADDVTRHVEYTATANIVPGQHLVVSRDTTERVEREAELTSKTQAMDNAPVGITLTDPNQDDNPLVYANEQFCELTGYDEDDIIGRNCRFLQGDETDSASVARIRQSIDAQDPVTETIRNFRKDGTPFWNRLTIAPITDEAGQLTNYVGFQMDITRQIERQQALEEERQRLQALIEASPNVIFAVDKGGSIQLWNDVAEALFGPSRDAVTGQSLSSLFEDGDEQRAELDRFFSRALAGEPVSEYEIRRRTNDGEQIHLRLSTAPITDESGAITGVMAVGTDLTGDGPCTPAD